MRRLVLIGVVALLATVAITLVASPAHAASPSVSEVESEMEFTYVFDVPEPLLSEVIGDQEGYSITADCWRIGSKKRWSCDLVYEPNADDKDITCEVAGSAWMTRRGLKTHRSTKERCG